MHSIHASLFKGWKKLVFVNNDLLTSILIYSWNVGSIEIVNPDQHKNEKKQEYKEIYQAIAFSTGILNFRHVGANLRLLIEK